MDSKGEDGVSTGQKQRGAFIYAQGNLRAQGSCCSVTPPIPLGRVPSSSRAPSLDFQDRGHLEDTEKARLVACTFLLPKARPELAMSLLDV